MSFIVVTSNEVTLELELRQFPGRAFAEAQLFVMIANVLKLFTIRPPAGNLAFSPEDLKYCSGIIRLDQSSYRFTIRRYLLTKHRGTPEPFECKILPRNEHVEDLLKQATESG